MRRSASATTKPCSGIWLEGASWEGFIIENLLAAAPERTVASFYRTSAGAEIDRVLEVPGRRAKI